jgi:hypothetical protein
LGRELNFFERQKKFLPGDLIQAISGPVSYGIVLSSTFEKYFGRSVPAGLEVLWSNGTTQICWVDDIEKII